ncbi:hypothetical protein [Deefgea piscis]|uniref:hypothetical protein n=1 Tax=Deefgea piscis TaxID=2739061 RepID=UPI001C7E7995|nr:hypothetical protein [Deefgea piscis]QZA80860.1 hypothetical protein K4H25_15420 [Deefgea piscis]
MTKKTALLAAEAPEAATADPFHGQGGSYIVNPDSGARELVSRTDMATTEDHSTAIESNEVKHADAI